MYQNSVLSTGQLIFMAVVVTASLAAWLIAVLLAARQPHGTSRAVRPREEQAGATVTQLPPEVRRAEPPEKTAALSAQRQEE